MCDGDLGQPRVFEVPVGTVHVGRGRRGVHRAPLPGGPAERGGADRRPDRLGLEPWDITRTTEAAAKDLGIRAWPRTPADRQRWIDALAEHPKLIQRPIITADDGTTVVGRSPEAVQSVLPGQ
nr:arsenate reductase [uncultured bacterium]AXL05813.1 arsenate reductase [uncultured bacterium]